MTLQVTVVSKWTFSRSSTEKMIDHQYKAGVKLTNIVGPTMWADKS